MIPLIGTLTLPAVSVLIGIGIIFLFVTVPDWYNRHQKVKSKESEKSSTDDKPIADTKARIRSKPGIEILKIDNQQSEQVDSSCACEDFKNNVNQDTCCKSDNSNSTLSCGDKKQVDTLVLDESIKKLVIVYGTTTGNAQTFAKMLSDFYDDHKTINTEIYGLSDIEAEDRLPIWAKELNTAFVVLISTHEGGSPPDNAKWFYTWLEESSKDFRVQHSMLKGLKYSVFGLGNSLYSDHYNTVAKHVDKFLFQLSASRFHSLCLGDENVAGSKHGNMEADFDYWKNSLAQRITKWNNSVNMNKDIDTEKTSDFDTNSSDESEDDSISEEDIDEMDEGMVDLEDLGTMIQKSKVASNEKSNKNGKAKEMITPLLRKSLTKQGYKLIGSHSGVKICRWTKAMLRGRGGCYKHTFYGIESHRCMETTPSLACANKCVFCWRHHSNPVGTEWKWAMDQPELILEGALENHYKMIKQMRGVPGVLPEKLEEGMNVQHCALSLVGEPIMYPEINKFVQLLHQKRISSFLVTNAQFPDAIRDMEPCTQLYVSIDASTKDSLKKIDRPLHKDFWERFILSLKELCNKGQRTVYRLTLVKGFNVEELDNYAKLVSLGKPDFIELKGVTYCGTSKGELLSISNYKSYRIERDFIAPKNLISKFMKVISFHLYFSIKINNGQCSMARRSYIFC